MSKEPELGKTLLAHVKAHLFVILPLTSATAFVVYFDDIRQMLRDLTSSLTF